MRKTTKHMTLAEREEACWQAGIAPDRVIKPAPGKKPSVSIRKPKRTSK